eukprot:scaffold135084_cov29-Prasinocladus_malaysianus.AAC.1
MARVVSRPAPDVVTVDAGSKSLAAESGDPVAYVVGRWAGRPPGLASMRFAATTWRLLIGV